MKKYRMVAVLFTAIVLMLSFTTVAYAASSGETSDGTMGNVTESVVQTPDTSSAAPIPAGTGTVIDSSTDGGGKEFLTIMTPDKNVFYLIIDRDQTSNNVYFLDAVTEKDLLSLAEKSGDTSDSSVSDSKPEKTSEPTSEPQAETSANPSPVQKQNNNTGMLIVVLAIVLIGGGAGYYFKIYRPKHQQADSEEENDYSADDETDLHAKDTEQADDLPPWEDEDDSAGDSEDDKE